MKSVNPTLHINDAILRQLVSATPYKVHISKTNQQIIKQFIRNVTNLASTPKNIVL